jgi:hypothetical protein
MLQYFTNNELVNGHYQLKSQLAETRQELAAMEKYLLATEKKIYTLLTFIKNNDPIPEDMMALDRTYCDLAPHEVIPFYQSKKTPVQVVDVSSEAFSSKNVSAKNFASVIKIPLEKLLLEHEKIAMDLPTLVISEDGVRSILGCELLFKLNFTYLFNVSGGYEFLLEGKS